MGILTDWVMQIIIFLLIGSIIELIVPKNNMKKYVNVALGLILLLIFAKPILQLFTIDINTEIIRVEQILFNQHDKEKDMKNLVEIQKREIENEQAAYILNEVKEQLKISGNEVLVEQYDVAITNIELQFPTYNGTDYTQLEEIIVTIEATLKQYDHGDIKPIEINAENDLQPIKTKQMKEIIKSLSEVWDVSEKQIKILQKGGTSW